MKCVLGKYKTFLKNYAEQMKMHSSLHWLADCLQNIVIRQRVNFNGSFHGTNSLLALKKMH